MRASPYHTETDDVVVFEDAKSRGYLREMLVGGVALVVLAFAAPWAETRFFGTEARLVDGVLLGAGIALLAWASKMWLVDSAGRGEQGLIVIDPAGIGGNAISSDVNARLEWARIVDVMQDGSAVIVRFKPRDLSSINPEDRKSLVRLSAARATPPEILAAINRFRMREQTN
ncbi:MAG: hypothetical protein KDA46_03670 [Parvularculaceae bacterium]|nr:hypothetical protein [Parvularculaceae bacterium]